MVNFEEDLKNFAGTIVKKKENIHTEETTKISLILPFIQLLGYDITDPSEVQAEYTADIGVKKNEKIDLTILMNGIPEILIECKPVNTILTHNQISQLYRYFNVTKAKFGILTNGDNYKIYTDIFEPNMMDEKPFLDITLSKINDDQIKELSKFTKSNYDFTKIREKVNLLKYKTDIKNQIISEMENPSEDFIKSIVKPIYSKPLKKTMRIKFSKMITETFNEVINEKVEKRLGDALNNYKLIENSLEQYQDDKGQYTLIEIEAYNIIKVILEDTIDVDRLFLRKRQTYTSIILDNNGYYPIIRLYLNKKTLKIGLFDSFKRIKNNMRVCEDITIEDINDLFNYKDRLILTTKHMIEEKKK